MLIDPPQTSDAQSLTKVMQLRGDWHLEAILQSCKLPPSALLVQQFNQQIERMGGS